MESSASVGTHALELVREHATTPAALFAAWTTAPALERWFPPTAELRPRVLALEPREGGRWRVEMTGAGGVRHVVSGVFTAFEPGARLASTWTWETDDEPEETLLHVRDQHDAGRTGCLARLAAHG